MLREAVERGEVDAARVVEDLEQRAQVETRLARGDHHLGGRGQADPVEEVVEQLGRVPAPLAPMWTTRELKVSSTGLTASTASAVAAGHHRQRPLLGGRRAAGDPGVDELDPALARARAWSSTVELGALVLRSTTI